MSTTRNYEVNWKVIPIALVYVVALTFVANMAFGASIPFAGGSHDRPARTALYGGLPPAAAPIDGNVIIPAINEANGGAATIGRARPAEQVSSDAASTPSTTAPVSANVSTPTSTAQAKVSTLTIADLMAMIPTNLTFPDRGKSSKHR